MGWPGRGVATSGWACRLGGPLGAGIPDHRPEVGSGGQTSVRSVFKTQCAYWVGKLELGMAP